MAVVIKTAYDQSIVRLDKGIGRVLTERFGYYPNNSLTNLPLNRNGVLVYAHDESIPRPAGLVGTTFVFFQWDLLGWIAEIHAVAVLKSYGGQGIGKKLVMHAISVVHKFSISKDATVKLALTSNPTRETANNIYQELGFELVARAHGDSGTNLYRMKVTPDRKPVCLEQV